MQHFFLFCFLFLFLFDIFIVFQLPFFRPIKSHNKTLIQFSVDKREKEVINSRINNNSLKGFFALIEV